MRRALPTMVAALSITGLLTAGTGPAAAAPVAVALGTATASAEIIPGGFASWDELFAVQQRMDTALERIDTVVQAGGYQGFGNVIAAPETHRLRVYWKGKVPAAVAQVIAEQRKLIPIDVLPAKFSQDEMTRTMKRLSEFTDLMELSANVDATGVSVLARSGSGISASMHEAMRTSVADVTVAGDSLGGLSVDRLDDSPPYYGGAFIKESAPCSAAFGVSFNGADLLFTAGHCVSYTAPPGVQYIMDGGDDVVGTVFRDNDARDIALIAGPSWGRVWDGPRNSTVSKPVQSAVATANGNWVCTSGATSGIRCGIQVLNNNTSYRDIETNALRSPMIKARRTDGQSAAGKGDSGGPVFSLPSPDNGKVIAKGIISGIDANSYVTCTPAAPVPNYVCGSIVYFADMKASMGWYGVTIKTA